MHACIRPGSDVSLAPPAQALVEEMVHADIEALAKATRVKAAHAAAAVAPPVSSAIIAPAAEAPAADEIVEAPAEEFGPFVSAPPAEPAPEPTKAAAAAAECGCSSGEEAALDAAAVPDAAALAVRVKALEARLQQLGAA